MISEKEYFKRRKKVVHQIKNNSVALFLSAPMQMRSNDTEFPYRQNSNFYYLSGFKEDNAALVFVKRENKTEVILFVEKKDPTLELWHGKRLGKEQAKKIFQVDKVYHVASFEKKLSEYLSFVQTIYFDFKAKDARVEQLLQKANALKEYIDIAPMIEKMRLVKSSAEIEMIKKALLITKEAHHKAMHLSKELEFEYQLQAEIEYVFKSMGAYSDAYSSIVACGNSANTLHYINNDKPLVDGELILIDAGCEYEYYASDITRTIPVNGKFSPAQKKLYSLVLEVEKEIISMVKPGVLRSDLHKKSEELLCQGMVDLGLLKGEVAQLLKDAKHKKYYPHGIGHWMGIDVHDQAPYKNLKGEEIPFRAGMVMTIEPGIYVDEEDRDAPKKFRGIGIRIEDDILVTKDGYENLSQGVVKEIKDIESLS